MLLKTVYVFIACLLIEDIYGQSEVFQNDMSQHIQLKEDSEQAYATYDIEEGQHLLIVCNISVWPGYTVVWQNTEGTFFQDGNNLDIANITRNYTGIYMCEEMPLNMVSAIGGSNVAENINKTIYYIDVFYPARIVHTSSNVTQLLENRTYVLDVEVEGNPIPFTTFSSVKDGKEVFQAQQEGNLTITMTVQCEDTGWYALQCENDLDKDEWMDNITVFCAPVKKPDYDVNETVQPRLGDVIALKMECIGNPYPNYTWWYHGIELFNHTDDEYSSVFTLYNVDVDDYGNYTLVFENIIGSGIYVYYVQAFGAPGPVTNLQVSNVTTNSVTLTWFSGFDYDDPQSYSIIDNGTVLRTFDDKSGGHGLETVIYVMDNLVSINNYSVSIQSQNSGGNSSSLSNIVKFTTTGPPAQNPKFHINGTVRPRLGETITLSMESVGYPQPNYTWWYQGRQLLNHKDDWYSSVMTIENIGVDGYGNYTILMQNTVGNFTYAYTVEAFGSPDPVTNLQVLNVTTNSVTLSWFSGFDYDDHQSYSVIDNDTVLRTFDDTSGGHGLETVIQMMDTLVSIKNYSVSIQSQNSRGNSSSLSNIVTFTTTGAPAQNPKYHINGTVRPRLGNTITLSMESVGYPQPNYSWWYQGRQLLNHKDNWRSSVLTIDNIGVDDYGNYSIDMQNIVGYFTYVYTVVAYGPPDPVTGLNVSNVATNSAMLVWYAGFDYGDHQSYIVLNNSMVFRTIEGTSGGHGMAPVSHMISNLNSSTYYCLSVRSENSRGNSSMPSNSVCFTTKNTDIREQSISKGLLLGSISGGAGFLLGVIIAIVYICRRKTPSDLERHFERRRLLG